MPGLRSLEVPYYHHFMAGTIIIGIRAVRQALAAGRTVNRVYLAKESRAKGFAELVEYAKSKSIPFDFVPQAKLNDLAGTRDHQGIIAAVSPVEYATLEECIGLCAERAVVLALDQVQHARNLGLMIRSAVGAGVSAVLLPSRKTALLDDTVVRASAGAVFNIPIACCSNLPTALRQLKEHNFWVYGLDASAGKTVFEMQWPKRCVLVVGNETSGIRPGVLKTCDDTLGIPLENNLDSLNVAVATGIALFQIAAGRAQSSSSSRSSD